MKKNDQRNTIHKKCILGYVCMKIGDVLTRAVLKWWAQYLEFKGKLQEAQKFYEKAEDLVAMARIYCALEQPDKVWCSWCGVSGVVFLVGCSWNGVSWCGVLGVVFSGLVWVT